MSDKYKSWKEKAERHDRLHDLTLPRTHWKEDLSCKECYPFLVTNKKFIRFWKWYRKIVPETKDMGYTSKTEETFTEILALVKEKLSKDREYKIRGKIGKLLGSIRYDKSPELKEKEIGKRLLSRIIISDSFEKSSEEIKKTVDEIIIESCSETESEASIKSDEEFDVSEGDDWYEVVRERIEEHEKYHTIGKTDSKEDLSCRRCFPVKKGTKDNTEFIDFWEWYQKLTKAESFSGLTVEIFEEIQQTNLSEVVYETEENAQRIWRLMCTVRYQEKPKLTRYQLTLKMMKILAVSKGFNTSLRNAAEKVKRAKIRGGIISEETTRENSPERESSSKRSTFIEELDTELKELAKTRSSEELEYEKTETHEITKIFCGIHGPYLVTGNGSEYEIIFQNVDEEYIDLYEFRRMCRERELNDELIFEQIQTILVKNAEHEVERTKSTEDEKEIHIEKDIKGSPISLESPSVESVELEENTDKKTTSEESSDNEKEIGNMALNVAKCKPFGGGVNENPSEWIAEFERVANANKWEEDDADNNHRTLMAAAHLTGEAGIWYDANKATYNRWIMSKI